MHSGTMRPVPNHWSTCPLFKRAQRALRSRELSELRQNEVLSIFYLYGYAQAIRICIQGRLASQRVDGLLCLPL
jgi:hypothetical protein